MKEGNRHTRMYYDRHFRSWVVYPLDDEENQTGAAVYAYTKKEAEKLRNEFEERYNNRTIEEE